MPKLINFNLRVSTREEQGPEMDEEREKSAYYISYGTKNRILKGKTYLLAICKCVLPQLITITITKGKRDMLSPFLFYLLATVCWVTENVVPRMIYSTNTNYKTNTKIFISGKELYQ